MSVQYMLYMIYNFCLKVYFNEAVLFISGGIFIVFICRY